MTIRITSPVAITAILASGVAAPVSADTVADFYKANPDYNPFGELSGGALP